jgi:hypothetical protein
MTTIDLRAVPGVAECTLSDAVAAGLPAEAPPAPWTVRCSSITWYGRGGRAAARAAGRSVVRSGRALATVGGLVAYADTPVGSYNEVFGVVAYRDGRSVRGTIPFMAVDSVTSLVGGRGNWSLPKTLAQFTGEPSAGGCVMSAEGDGWLVRATARPFGPSFRVPMTSRMVQPWPDGVTRESLLTGTGRSRSAIVTVEVDSRADLPGWLRPGRHFGSVLTDVGFTLGEAVPISS